MPQTRIFFQLIGVNAPIVPIKRRQRRYFRLNAIKATIFRLNDVNAVIFLFKRR